MRTLLYILLLWPAAVFADEPKVVDAWRDGSTVSVTLSHPDTGWDHYADGWEVVTADGTRVGFRELLHPHVAEQPFTRSLRLDEVPNGPLFIRTRCSRDGWFDTLTPLAVR